MLPVKRKRAEAKPKAPKAPKPPPEPSADAKLRKHLKLTKEVDQLGVQPSTSHQLFVIQGVNAYALHEENLVSLAKSADAAAAARARSPLGRRRLVINAGTPSSKNPMAGALFHKLSGKFVPTDCELHEKRWYEPKPLNFELSHHPYCSEADVLARYAGCKALTGKGGADHFLVYFLNQGDLNLVDKHDDDQDFRVFLDQRDRIEANLRKLFLVYPKRVKPQLNEAGNPVPVAEGEPVWHDVPYAVACFASILSDKREGKPGATSGVSIGGYHEKCRLWPLRTKVLEKIRQVMEHFDIDIPALSNPLAGTLDLEAVRKQYLDELGPPPIKLTAELQLDTKWLEKRANLPFCKPWVQVCNFNHPNGEVDDDNKPVLVPLYKGCAEERNGHCWLDPDALDVTLPHGQHVHEALSTLVGRTYKRPPAHTEAVVRELQETISQLRSSVSGLQKRCEDSEKAHASTKNELAQLTDKHLATERILNAASTSRFSRQEAAGIGYKVLLGGVDARVTVQSRARGVIQLTKPSGECLATWNTGIGQGDKLLLRFTQALADGGASGESS